MITANEARKRTQDIIKSQQADAMKIVENEWSQFIEPKIIEAIDKGAYGCKHFWMNSFFIRAKVDVEMFVRAFKDYGDQLGYQINEHCVYENNEVIRLDIRISWYQGETVKCLN